MFDDHELAAIDAVKYWSPRTEVGLWDDDFAAKIGHALRHLDLSPLARFVRPTLQSGREILAEWVSTIYTPYYLRRVDVGVYDIWSEPYTAPAEPEKSPQDKALDEFIAKRKAKRDGFTKEAEFYDGKGWSPEQRKRIDAVKKEIENGQALGRALSKAYVHHVEVGERLMPYRVVL